MNKSTAAMNVIQKSQWFPHTRSTVPPTQGTLDAHETYVKKSIRQLSPQVYKKLKVIIDSGKHELQKQESGSTTDANDIFRRLSDMPLESFMTYVKSELEQLNTARSGLDLKRDKGISKVNAKTQSFVSEFDRFLTAYSGIVNIVSSADAQYGGVATATLSLLFSTVMMKVKDEEAITSAMRQISDRLPDFHVYQRIYPDASLGSMLIEAYKDIILLAREATSYFQSSTLGRHLRSIGKPLEFEIMEKNMRENFNRIRTKCETLLAQRVDQLMGEIEELQKRHDSSVATGLRSSLHLDDYRLDEAVQELIKYRGALQATFDNDRHRQKMEYSDFLDGSLGPFWTSKDSAVFLLHGLNEPGKCTVSDSWLSPLAVDLIQIHMKRGHTVGFEICNRSSTLSTVLKRLIFQLLEKNPRAIRKAEAGDEIMSRISGQKEGQEENLMSALVRLIDLQAHPVYLVLDRPELSEDDGAAQYIEGMLHLVGNVQTQLKILVVTRTEVWDFEQERKSIIKGTDPKLFHILQLDQRRL